MRISRVTQDGVFLGEAGREETKEEIEGVKSMVDFKFAIGERVHNTAFGYNAVVMRRLYTEDKDSKYNSYDLAIWESSPPMECMGIAEIYLEHNFRVE